MFNKILIANRGEIACRVMASAHRLGIATVAVHSDADARARHVTMATEAVRIGPAPAAESYLQANTIIDAALHCGAEAIHPGYGFLSENPAFVEAVKRAGLVFIGPSADAIRAMGLKDSAKRLMEQAGVPVVPGYHGEDQSDDRLQQAADAIGYPVLIKARAGGGGKGMRLVQQHDAFAESLAVARREAEASFGDSAVLVEKFISCPRHVEIQVLGDTHGTLVHLFERDCSLQRRHQKVIEEAPAPGMSPAVREAMGKAAVEAARAIDYHSAGTVEFICDASDGLRSDGFWFMEMNTRLQVEHPVTEAITGLDLVEWQLRVACGEALPFDQTQLGIDGWSIEARLYAEDVPGGFLPAVGTLQHLVFAEGSQFGPGRTRIDSGVDTGDTITPWYDPMIAKLIVHAADRPSALNRMRQTLVDCQVAGLVTNLDFLTQLVTHPAYVAGNVDTGLIGREVEALCRPATPPPLMVALAALSALGLLDDKDPTDPWTALASWQLWSAGRSHIDLTHADQRWHCSVGAQGDGRFACTLTASADNVDDHDIDGAVIAASDKVASDGAAPYEVAPGIAGSDSDYQATAGPAATPADSQLQGLSLTFTVLSREGSEVAVREQDHRRVLGVFTQAGKTGVFCEGRSVEFHHADPLAGSEDISGDDRIVSPMPGVVKQVSARAGEHVTRGATLLVLEAMKMEHALLAPRDALVAEVLASEGDQVSDGALLVRLEAAS